MSSSQPSTRSFVAQYFAIVVLICITFVTLLRREPTKVYTYVGDDFPNRLPDKLPDRQVEMQMGAPAFSLYSDDDWFSLFPEGWYGFMSLGPDNRPFSLSLYHQLHCLDAIRTSFILNGTDAALHVEHCLRYLKVSLLCLADTTLEPASWVKDDEGYDLPATNGMGVIHQCKDWGALKELVEAHPVIMPTGKRAPPKYVLP